MLVHSSPPLRPLHIRLYRCLRLRYLRDRRWTRDNWMDLQW
jgi:hypothetical protein